MVDLFVIEYIFSDLCVSFFVQWWNYASQVCKQCFVFFLAIILCCCLLECCSLTHWKAKATISRAVSRIITMVYILINIMLQTFTIEKTKKFWMMVIMLVSAYQDNEHLLKNTICAFFCLFQFHVFFVVILKTNNNNFIASCKKCKVN